MCAPLVQNGDMGVLGVESLEVQGGSKNFADCVDCLHYFWEIE